MEWTLTVENCCREEPILTPCWNCFFDLLFIAVVFISIHNGLPQRTLPRCLIVKLKWLCSVYGEIIWPCPSVNCYKEKKRLTHSFQRLALPREILQDLWPLLLYFLIASPTLFCLLTLVPPCFSLWFYKRTWHPDPTRWSFWDISLPSSWSAGFLNSNIPCLSASFLRFIGLSCGEQSEHGLMVIW